MALCFGEIDVKTSRVFLDEDDAYDDDLRNTCIPDRSFKIIWATEKNILQYKFDVLIFVDGAFMKVVFERGVVANAELVAKIVSVKNNTESKAKKDEVVAQLYLLEGECDKALVCICEANVDGTNSLLFTKEVYPLMLLSKVVMVMTSSNVSSYSRGDQENELPISFFKSLHTDTYKEETFCERLEQPNMVSGISAQVLTWCQVVQLPAVLFICYSQCNDIDSVTAKPIGQLLLKLNITNLQVNIAKLRNVHSVNSSSLLYM